MSHRVLVSLAKLVVGTSYYTIIYKEVEIQISNTPLFYFENKTLATRVRGDRIRTNPKVKT
jgi:hypothetical protein